MKRIITSLAILSGLVLGTIQFIQRPKILIKCGSTNLWHKRTYPLNDAAINLAASLNLRLCTGSTSTRFRDAVKNGHYNARFYQVNKFELKAARSKLIHLLSTKE